MKIGIPQSLILSSIILAYLQLHVAMWVFFSTGIVAALFVAMWHFYKKSREFEQQLSHDKERIKLVQQYSRALGLSASAVNDPNNDTFH